MSQDIILRLYLPLALLASLANVGGGHAQQPAAPPGPNNLVLSCTGPFAADSSIERLRQVFGARNVRNERLDGPEGETLSGTVIYPDDPTRRVEIVWHNTRRRARPNLIRIQDAPPEGSLWRGPNGLRIGSTLEETEAANGGPFELAGFDWDYSGMVTQWKGALDRVGGDENCEFRGAFDPDRELAEDVLDKVTGDEFFSSTDPNMRAARPRLRLIGLQFGEPPRR